MNTFDLFHLDLAMIQRSTKTIRWTNELRKDSHLDRSEKNERESFDTRNTERWSRCSSYSHSEKKNSFSNSRDEPWSWSERDRGARSFPSVVCRKEWKYPLVTGREFVATLSSFSDQKNSPLFLLETSTSSMIVTRLASRDWAVKIANCFSAWMDSSRVRRRSDHRGPCWSLTWTVLPKNSKCKEAKTNM